MCVCTACMCLWFPSNILCHETVSLHLYSSTIQWQYHHHHPKKWPYKQMRDKTKQKCSIAIHFVERRKKEKLISFTLAAFISCGLTNKIPSDIIISFMNEFFANFNAITKSGILNYNFLRFSYFVFIFIPFNRVKRKLCRTHSQSIMVFHLAHLNERSVYFTFLSPFF